MGKYVIGVDFGTDSCRAVLVDAENGLELDSEVSYYSRWKRGLYCSPQRQEYRQHPLDYTEALTRTVSALCSRCGESIRRNIAAISADTTGSTPCAVNEKGVPLALLPEFAEDPDAMFILWKDHSAVNEAVEINAAAKAQNVDYTKYVGGVYSSEWFYSKILHVLRTNEWVRNAAYSWVEHCDWIPAYLTGVTDSSTVMRSRCSAGHKAMWHAGFGGLPPEEFFTSIDPLLLGLRARLFSETYTMDKCAGTVTDEIADALGLPRGVKVGIGGFDCHMGAVGGNIAPGSLVKVMGTSTCDIIVCDYETMGGRLVAGICGQVDGSVIPGMIGLEAGQSSFGDAYDWFKRLIAWPLGLISGEKIGREGMAHITEIEDSILFELEREATKIKPAESGVLALDWMNGRRTPFADQSLKAAITGITLSTDAPQVYRAIIEATAFGARAVTERFHESGITVNEVIAIGGIAKKSPLIMQIIADTLKLPVKVCASDQCVALGAAIFAAVAGGLYPDVATAQSKMASPATACYLPNAEQAALYDGLYKKYLVLGRFVEQN